MLNPLLVAWRGCQGSSSAQGTVPEGAAARAACRDTRGHRCKLGSELELGLELGLGTAQGPLQSAAKAGAAADTEVRADRKRELASRSVRAGGLPWNTAGPSGAVLQS